MDFCKLIHPWSAGGTYRASWNYKGTWPWNWSSVNDSTCKTESEVLKTCTSISRCCWNKNPLCWCKEAKLEKLHLCLKSYGPNCRIYFKPLVSIGPVWTQVSNGWYRRYINLVIEKPKRLLPILIRKMTTLESNFNLNMLLLLV